ncbi:hypothetical protein FDK38_003822 [Candidozyma auris]|nr:hypothetical protein FDK38_003822 [[Candida] auris]
MEGLVTTFKKLRERVSPLKEVDENASNLALLSTESYSDHHIKKRQSSDPFDDRVSKRKSKPISSKSSSLRDSRFIRDENLKSLSREKTPSETKPDEKKPEEHVETNVSEPAEDDENIPLEVLEEMHKLEESFPVLAEKYRLIDKIGEGTFSTVYKAEAVNGAVLLGSQMWKSPPLQKVPSKRSKKPKRKNPLVALKQIYVTSSPNRIYNELNLLYMLSGNSHVAPLLDILRLHDQVLAILPYYQHADFRDFYRDIPIKGIKKYMWELFQGLEFVHSKGIMHRDLKPTNFLYDPFKGKGVLVDFGLAEKMPSAYSSSNSRSANTCPCLSEEKSLRRVSTKRLNIKAAYPKVDQRPPRRANRAGTRGFRAPEVLLKCTNQSTKIDVWSAGVIGLSLISRKFPLFNSPDDIDALIEILLIFGQDKLQKAAELHGCGLEVNLQGAVATSFNGNLVKFLSSVLHHEKENESIPTDSVIHDTLAYLDPRQHVLIKPTIETSDVTDNQYEDYRKKLEGYTDLKHLLQLLYGCFSMDPSKRLSASQLLKLPFFSELKAHEDDEVVL